jgi:hypothetical protein
LSQFAFGAKVFKFVHRNIGDVAGTKLHDVLGESDAFVPITDGRFQIGNFVHMWLLIVWLKTGAREDAGIISNIR